MHLAGKHNHRVALARSLRVPKNSQLTLLRLALTYCRDGTVDAMKLVIAGDDLPCAASGFIKQNEVFHQIEKITLLTHTLEQRLHIHRARRFLIQTFPLVEVPPAAGDRTDLRLLTVAEHHNGIVVKQVRNGVEVVGEVLLKGGFQIPVDILALDKQQRNTVDETDDVRPPPVEIAAHPQLAHAEEMVVFRHIEIEQPQALPHPLALIVAEGNLHPIAYQVVLLAVGGG